MILLSPFRRGKPKFFEEYGATLRSRVSKADLDRASDIQHEMAVLRRERALPRVLEDHDAAAPSENVPITVVKSILRRAGTAILSARRKQIRRPRLPRRLELADALASQAPVLIIRRGGGPWRWLRVVTALPNAGFQPAGHGRILRLESGERVGGWKPPHRPAECRRSSDRQAIVASS
jgi:hypothetical protein